MTILSIIHLNIGSDDEPEVGLELKNARGFLLAVCQRFGEAYPWSGHSYDTMSDSRAPFWRSYGDPRALLAHRVVLAMTYDRAYIEPQDFVQTILHIEETLETWPDMVEKSHLPAIRDYLSKMVDVGCKDSIAFCSSVADDLWQGPWDEENERYGPPDWSQTWSLYEEF